MNAGSSTITQHEKLRIGDVPETCTDTTNNQDIENWTMKIDCTEIPNLGGMAQSSLGS